MTFAFDRETAVVSGGEGMWGAHIAPHWNIGDKPNGGYLMAVLLQALRSELALGIADPAADQPDPLTLTAHFLRPGIPDAPGTISTEVLKRGRSISTVRGTLVQDGKTRVEMMAGFGSLANDEPADVDIDLPAPAFPPVVDGTDRATLVQGVKEMSLLDRVEVRVLPEHSQIVLGADARMAGWIRFLDERPADTVGLALFADAFPPSLFSKLGTVGWVPTLEMTVQIRRRPAPGWLAASFQTDDLAGGRFIETGTLWDTTGQVVAHSRQLGLLLT